MVKYVSLVKQRLESFAAWKLEHISRDSNEKVDALEIVAASILIKKRCSFLSTTSQRRLLQLTK